MKRQLLAATICMTAVAGGFASEARPFLFLKSGEKFATQEAAGPSLIPFTEYISSKVGVSFEPRIMNEPVKAAEMCAAKKPPMGIVTPGFYLAYAKALGMEPLLQVKRTGMATEKYVLVGRKDGSDKLEDWQGRTVATALAGEANYVLAVILQGKLGRESRLKPTSDAEGDLFAMAESAQNGPELVLVEEVAWKTFAEDGELAAALKVLFLSDDLPKDLVVVFGGNATSVDTGKVATALKEMAADESGKDILTGIRVDGFEGVDKEKLEKSQKLFQGR
jgi:hypothetical protein